MNVSKAQLHERRPSFPRPATIEKNNIILNIEEDNKVNVSNRKLVANDFEVLIKKFENESISSDNFRNTDYMITEFKSKILSKIKDSIKASTVLTNIIVYHDIAFRKFTSSSSTHFTLEEFQKGLERIFHRELPLRLVEELFLYLDANNDNKIDKTEFIKGIIVSYYCFH